MAICDGFSSMVGTKNVRKTCRSVYLRWPDLAQCVVLSKAPWDIPHYEWPPTMLKMTDHLDKVQNAQELGPGLFWALLTDTDPHRIPF